MKKQPMGGIKDPGRASGYFATLARSKPKPTLSELSALFAAHHCITIHNPLADVVVACVCSPDVARNTAEWAGHLLLEIAHFDTSGATAPVGQASAEPPPAGACRVIPIRK